MIYRIKDKQDRRRLPDIIGPYETVGIDTRRI
jgi:hypothetical protein